MICIIVLLAAAGLARCAPNSTTKPFKYEQFNFPQPLKISDDELIIQDVSTFAHNHSLSAAAPRGSGNKTARRIWPHYQDMDIPGPYYRKLMEIMKQSIYATQDRLKHLTAILEKYRDDVPFRCGFIFSKLDQLLEDMRRIYTFAVRKLNYKRIEDNIIFFKHLTKKNVDVTYIVEFMFVQYERDRRNLAKFSSHFSLDVGM